MRQSQRQIYRRGAFAHAAFAGGHGNDVFHAGHEFHATLHRMGDDFLRHGDAHIAHAGDGLHRGNRRAANEVELGIGGIAKLHIEGHIRAFDADISG